MWQVEGKNSCTLIPKGAHGAEAQQEGLWSLGTVKMSGTGKGAAGAGGLQLILGDNQERKAASQAPLQEPARASCQGQPCRTSWIEQEF